MGKRVGLTGSCLLPLLLETELLSKINAGGKVKVKKYLFAGLLRLVMW